MKILIAEDDPGILESYVDLLSKHGHQVTPTKDGLQCLNTYRKELASLSDNSQEKTPFDVIIIDFAMPFVNGADAVKTIHDLCPSQKIIFATAHSDELLEEILLSDIDIEILKKPFSYSDLNNLIEKNTITSMN